MLNVAFYGVRGSTPVSGADVLRYGGNTSCVVLTGPSIDPIVLDLGTGLRRYGIAHGMGTPFKGTALVSHLHWDHVQGLPFFGPVLQPGAHLEVFGPSPVQHANLRDAFDTFMQPPFFPVTIADLAGHIEVTDAPHDAFKVSGGAHVTAREVPHVGYTLGFRITVGATTIAYLPDHQQPMDGSMDVADSVLELVEGVDLLIHDAQFLPEEFARKANWGHCTTEYALMVARQGGAKRLALFHHDPLRSDDALDHHDACTRAAGLRLGVEVVTAAEGMQLVFD